MNYRRFGNTELMVSQVGFGCWAIGGGAKVGDVPIGWANTSDEDSMAAIKTALDIGINFFDTADFYGLGHSEELLGKVLAGQKAIIATKVGHRNLSGKIVLDYSYPYIVQACEKSLERLRVETIDYYQLHSARLQHLQQGECIEAMEKLKQDGKIRYWGLSLNTFQPAPEAQFLINNHLGDGLQLVLNLINRRAVSLLEPASRAGFGLIARMPLQFGLLTGKFSGGTKFENDDHRSFRLTEGVIEQATEVLDKYAWPSAVELGMSKTAFALNFILHYPAISTTIPGMKNVHQVRINTEDIRSIDPAVIERLSASNTTFETLLEEIEKLG